MRSLHNELKSKFLFVTELTWIPLKPDEGRTYLLLVLLVLLSTKYDVNMVIWTECAMLHQSLEANDTEGDKPSSSPCGPHVGKIDKNARYPC